jgi:hypothetical protein
MYLFFLLFLYLGELSLVQASTMTSSQSQSSAIVSQAINNQQSQSQQQLHQNISIVNNLTDNNSSSSSSNNCDCSNKPLVECIKCSLLCHENCINENKICSNCTNE